MIIDDDRAENGSEYISDDKCSAKTATPPKDIARACYYRSDVEDLLNGLVMSVETSSDAVFSSINH